MRKMRLSRFARGGEPYEEDRDEIEDHGDHKGPEIIVGLVEDISGKPSSKGRS